MNDKLYCVADGNPNPTCIWIDLDTSKEVSKGCLLLIDEKMRRDKMYNYECRTENEFAGVKNIKSANTTFRIILDQTGFVIFFHSVCGHKITECFVAITGRCTLCRLNYHSCA